MIDTDHDRFLNYETRLLSIFLHKILYENDVNSNNNNINNEISVKTDNRRK